MIEKIEQELATIQVLGKLSNEASRKRHPWDRCCGTCIKIIYSTLHGVKSQLSAYADDHQIYCSNLNLHTAIDRIKKDGEETSRWYKTNFLQGNYNKYQAMAVARDTQQMELVIDDCRVHFTDAFKLPGVIVDKDLNFSQHISEVCIKTSKMIGVLQSLKNLIPMNAKLRNQYIKLQFYPISHTVAWCGTFAVQVTETTREN